MNEQPLRDHVISLLNGGSAHLTFDAAIADLPVGLRGVCPERLPHSPWRLLEHLRIAQWDILEFSRNAAHVSPEFPAGYWPPHDGPVEANEWDTSVESFRSDLAAMKSLVADPTSDLFSPFAHGSGQTLLREALLVADHNAYHIGQLVVVRRCLGAWGE